jgi:1-acyl-sn-glycerol-3-phosphate acyltransferase
MTSQMRSFARGAGGYAVAWSLGNIIGPIVMLLILFRIVRIRGYENLLRSALKGRLIIAPNHPTLIETLIIPGLLWPWYLVFPRLFVWSVPDHRLFHTCVKWTYPVVRCVTVDREKRAGNIEKAYRVRSILKDGGIVVIHPEGGRTIKGAEFTRLGGRRVRRIRSLVPWIAAESSARILPVWISIRRVRTPVTYGEGVVRLFHRSHCPIIFSFGHGPYAIAHPVHMREENKKLEQLILTS